MPARWDIAAVIIAFITVFVSASPTAIAILQQASRRLYCLVLPARGQCLRLLWSDIQEGLLHHCDPRNCSQTNHQSIKPHDIVNCWVDTLGRVFNRTWYFMNSDSNVTKYITKKPDELPLDKEYIQTDIQTLKAFLLLTADVCHSCETVDTATLLEIQRCRGLITIHLPLSGPMPVNTQFTKAEINRIIEGYPPFCREKFTTTGGITLPFPTTNSDHIGQGGWILSVGMSVTIGPTPSLHNMQRVTHEKPDAYWRGTLVLTAFHMIGRTLAQLKTYEDSQHEHPRSNPSKRAWSQDALTCFQTIMAPGYSIQPWALKEEQIERSDLFKSIMGECLCYSTCIGDSNHAVTCGRNQHKRKDPAKSLNKDQCNAALKIFSNYQLATQNLEIIWPVLPEVLQSVILGMLEVEHYFSYTSQKLELPKEIIEQRYIYLRRCPKDAS